MPVAGELVLDYTTYRRMALSPGGGAVWRWVYRSIGLVMLLCMGGVAATGNGHATMVWLIVVALGFIFGQDLLVLLGWQRTRKLTDRPFRYEMTNATLAIHTAQTSMTVGWDAISRARIRPHAWVYRLVATRGSLVVPRAAFSPEAQREIDRFIEQRFPTRAAGTRTAS